MTGPRAPAGWYPDPSDANVVRYWDGTRGPTSPPRPHRPCPSIGRRAPNPRPTSPHPWCARAPTPAWAKVGMWLLVAFVIVGIAVFAIGSVNDPDAPFGAQPADEREVVELIEDARREYDAANHDLQRDAALADRDERICALLGDGRVEDWTGKIYEIDSNGDGKGIIGINIEPNTQVTTRSSAFSADDTLIPPGPLLDRVTELEKGQVVTFSGRFIPDEDGPCFTNPRHHPAAEHRQAADGLPVQRRAPVAHQPVQVNGRRTGYGFRDPSVTTQRLPCPRRPPRSSPLSLQQPGLRGSVRRSSVAVSRRRS